jgi:hypothetical protein
MLLEEILKFVGEGSASYKSVGPATDILDPPRFASAHALLFFNS